MKTTTLSCLLAALSSAAVVLAGGIQVATERNYDTLATAAPTAMVLPDVLLSEEGKLELREIVNAAPTQAPMQVPSVTVQMLETSLKGATGHTWLPVTYTQKFSPTPDPWPLPGSGTIGLGTLTKTKKDKRDAEPTPVAPKIYIPFELVVRRLKVEQQVVPVQEVEVIQPVTVTHFVYGNSTSQRSTSAAPTTLSTSRSAGSEFRTMNTYSPSASAIRPATAYHPVESQHQEYSLANGSAAFPMTTLYTSSRGVPFDSPHTAWTTQLAGVERLEQQASEHTSQQSRSL